MKKKKGKRAQPDNKPAPHPDQKSQVNIVRAKTNSH